MRAAVAILALTVPFLPALAQTAAPPPPPPPPPGQDFVPMRGVSDPGAWVAPSNVAYTIVSIRPHKPGPFMPALSPDGLRLANTLHDFIIQAWNIPDDKLLAGGPSWAGSDVFDIEAKIDTPDLPSKRLTFPQLITMLQPVLVDRFQLKTHHEMREFPTYNVVIAKGGIKMKPAAAPSMPAPPGLTACMYGIKSAGYRSAHNCSIADIASMFSHSAGRFLIDKTGLTGRYDFEFCYSNERTPEGDPNYQCPTLFTAFQEQLGLKLEPSTAPLDVLVIDSAEKPTPN